MTVLCFEVIMMQSCVQKF